MTTPPTFPRALDSAGLLNWAIRSARELGARRAEINALNVFPVPDADTGSNMAFTMQAAVQEAERAAAEGGNIAQALAVGSVRGARGNSGMVLSQVLRGVADSTQDSQVDATVLADALALAVELVHRALAEPVEGTIISVLKAAATQAEASHSAGEALHPLLVQVVAAAQDALDNTPSQLPALREAGVVDAGGAGLVVLLDCLLAELEGAAMVGETTLEEAPSREIELVFLFDGDVEALRGVLEREANSVVLVPTGLGPTKVHAHSAVAGRVIEQAFALGTVTELVLEVLPETPETTCAPAPRPRTLFAVAPAGPVADVFATIGAHIIPPADAETFAWKEAVAAGDIVLRNGAALTPALVEPAILVDTPCLVAGIAAVSVADSSEEDSHAIAETMAEASAAMRVARPPAATTAALILAARELLAEGGEQVTILSPHPLDVSALRAKLGVDVMALHAPGIDPEVGVE